MSRISQNHTSQIHYMAGIIGQSASAVSPKTPPPSTTFHVMYARIVWTIWCMTQPSIPIQTIRNFSIRLGYPLSSTQHIVRLHMNNFAKFTTLNIFFCRKTIRSTSVLKTNLHYSIVFGCRLYHFSPFPNIDGRILFNIHIFACLTSPNGSQCMPMFRS